MRTSVQSKCHRGQRTEAHKKKKTHRVEASCMNRHARVRAMELCPIGICYLGLENLSLHGSLLSVECGDPLVREN